MIDRAVLSRIGSEAELALRPATEPAAFLPPTSGGDAIPANAPAPQPADYGIRLVGLPSGETACIFDVEGTLELNDVRP